MCMIQLPYHYLDTLCVTYTNHSGIVPGYQLIGEGERRMINSWHIVPLPTDLWHPTCTDTQPAVVEHFSIKKMHGLISQKGYIHDQI